MAFGAEIIYQRASFPSAALGFSDLAGSQCFEVVVPPVKPPPEKRRELLAGHDRKEDIEALRCLGRFVKPVQDQLGFVPEYSFGDVACLKRAPQTPQFIDHHTASNKNGDLRCAQVKDLIPLHLTFGSVKLRFQTSVIAGALTSSQNSALCAIR
jgi:hypothetical protein